MIPPKWALGILVGVIGYCLLQPIANRSFGWQLPSLAEVVNGRQEEVKRPQRPDETPKPPTQKSAESAEKSDLKPTTKTDLSEESQRPKKAPQRSDSKSSVATEPQTAPKPTASIEKSRKVESTDAAELASKLGVSGSDLRFGYLKEVGRERYQSPAGLVYTRGSEEGHRLKHLQRHLTDQPSRPGPHGVFKADMPQVLRWIDEAYQKASKGDRMAKTRRDEDSTIYEFTFAMPIGFVGGSEGKRKKNPPTNRLRLVVIDKNVITAFPF